MTPKEIEESCVVLHDFLNGEEKEGKVIPREIYSLITKIQHELYTQWNFNPENIGNCSECPYNNKFHSHRRGERPCGQYCRVDVACNPEKYKMW